MVLAFVSCSTFYKSTCIPGNRARGEWNYDVRVFSDCASHVFGYCRVEAPGARPGLSLPVLIRQVGAYQVGHGRTVQRLREQLGEDNEKRDVHHIRPV